MNRMVVARALGVAVLAFALTACGGGGEPAAGSSNGPPMNSDTQRDGLIYAVTLEMSPGVPQVLLGAVTITNVANVPLTLAFHNSCIVTLRAYDGVERVWDQRDFLICNNLWEEFPLLPGAQQVFRLDFAVSDLINSSLLPGLYTLTVQLQPFPAHVPQRRDVELYAGDFDLRG